jgi:hypothetical protein
MLRNTQNISRTSGEINLKSETIISADGSGKPGHYIMATLLYLGMGLAFTYPLILNLQSSFYGFPGDPYGIYGLWWTKYAIFDLHISPMYCPIVGYPFGSYYMYPNFILVAITLFITLLSGEVAAFNLAIIFSFITAGIGTYYLLYLITKNKYASFVGGCIFTFAPYHFAHAIHHLGLAQIQWFPFCLAFLFKLRIDRSYKNALLFTLFLVLQMFSDAYYAFFTVIMVLTFLAAWIYSDHLKSMDVKTVKLGFLSLSITAITAALTYIFLMRPSTSHAGVVPTRDLSELVIYSVRPWDFFVPMIYHPVFGKYTFDFIMSHLHGSNPVEQTIYLGYVPLMLAIFAIYKWKNGSIQANQTGHENFAIVFSSALIMISLLFMLPAYIQFHNFTIPFSLSYFLYKITPIFRVMVRFDVLIMLAVAILAAIGLKYVTKSKIAILIILGLVMFEYTPVPVADPLKLAGATRPGQIFPYSEESYQGDTTLFKIPEVYYWLAKKDNISIIAEYPMVDAPSEYETVYYRYLFYQRIHKKTLINGASPESKAIQKLLYNLDDRTVNILSELGVTHILVHGSLNVESRRLKPVKYFDNITVYEVTDNSSTESTYETASIVVAQMDGWYNQELWNGIPARWINGDAGLLAFARENCTARFSFNVMSFSKPRTLTVSANGISVLNKVIPLDNVNISCQTSLKRGFNILQFHVPEGCTRPADNPLLRNNDGRCLSLAIQNFTLSKI